MERSLIGSGNESLCRDARKPVTVAQPHVTVVAAPNRVSMSVGRYGGNFLHTPIIRMNAIAVMPHIALGGCELTLDDRIVCTMARSVKRNSCNCCADNPSTER